MAILRKLNWFFKEERRNYFVGVIALIFVAIFQLMPPRIIGLVIDEIASRHLSIKSVVLWASVLVVAAVCQYLLRYIWRQKIWGGAAKLEQLLRQRLFVHYTKMDQVFFQQHRTGDLMAHATNDLNAIQNVAGSGILSLADAVITGGSTMVAMILFVDWRLTLIAFIPLPLLAILASRLGQKMHDGYTDYQAAFSAINDKAQESITGMKVIKTFGQEKEDIADFEKKIDHAIEKGKRVFFLDALFDPLITLIIGLSYILTIVFGGYLLMQGSITMGQLISFISYIGMLVWPMFAIGQLFNILEKGSASYDRVLSVLQEKSHIKENQKGTGHLAKGAIEFHVTEFAYPKDHHTALKDISFKVDEGATLGITGKTGAGKTSIIKLLLREFDDYDGLIEIGEHDIRRYSLDELLRGIGYVPQDHFLFSMTIAENIRFAVPHASEEKIIKAASEAAIHEDILQLPAGYETLTGERGVALSGGQKQRISIARALILDPELLILDDALSAVDGKTEEKILTTLKEKRKDKTTIICAHRLSSVKHAQEIIVLDEGRIIQRGDHESLMAQTGWYKDMYERQQLEEELKEGGVK